MQSRAAPRERDGKGENPPPPPKKNHRGGGKEEKKKEKKVKRGRRKRPSRLNQQAFSCAALRGSTAPVAGCHALPPPPPPNWVPCRPSSSHRQPSSLTRQLHDGGEGTSHHHQKRMMPAFEVMCV
ncbi:hypothetical protein LX32DRAFT_340340 [Colletotrichum zoysiae]|uniref:Uncharacterized protein n=1 Tax=Colletotrichum zoysiae TaxID=1216348 RepID=A0AAD9MA48_9PEZI|nr:hypothetical protein LX32DRAFT_340340 [Colletotrichum zoysiae]